MEEILTSKFSIRPSVHARLALARRSARFWMALALPFLILIVAGFYYDIRLLYVAAIILFILFPTLALIAWYSLLSRPSAVNATFPQTVKFNRDDEITVRYYPLPSSTPQPGQESAALPGDDIRPKVPAELIIPASDVTDCRLYGDYIDMSYGAGNELLIPISALPSPQTITVLLNRFGVPFE